jgi:hypothetical protein
MVLPQNRLEDQRIVALAITIKNIEDRGDKQ